MKYDYWEMQKEFDKWTADEMPAMKFPSDWLVRIIAPFGGATARFHVSLEGKDGGISVYFDTTNALGYYDGPYWEAYPINGDTERFGLGEETKMLEAINNELRSK